MLEHPRTLLQPRGIEFLRCAHVGHLCFGFAHSAPTSCDVSCSHAMHTCNGPSPWQSCAGLAWDSWDEGCEPQKKNKRTRKRGPENTWADLLRLRRLHIIDSGGRAKATHIGESNNAPAQVFAGTHRMCLVRNQNWLQV